MLNESNRLKHVFLLILIITAVCVNIRRYCLRYKIFVGAQISINYVFLVIICNILKC